MKPTKNHIYCPACRRPKMLFETQAKADNFIKFNGDEILEENGKAPTRSYYCELCGGYHVTSIDSKEVGESIDRQVKSKIRKFSAFNEEAIQDFKYISSKIVEARTSLCQDKIDDYDDAVAICEFELYRLREKLKTQPFGNKYIRLTNRLRKLKDFKTRVFELLELPEEEQQIFLQTTNKKDVAKALISILNARKNEVNDI